MEIQTTTPLYVAEVWATPAHECDWSLNQSCPVCEDVDRRVSFSGEFASLAEASEWAENKHYDIGRWSCGASVRLYPSGAEEADAGESGGEIVWEL